MGEYLLDENMKEKEKNNYNTLKEKISQYYQLESNNNKILIVGHSSNQGGAEILLKNLIHEFKKQNIDPVVLVKTDGPLRKEYEKLAPTFLIENLNLFEEYIIELKKYGYKSAILNTIVCGDLIPLLHEWNYFTMNLVHELPGMVKILKGEEYVKIIANKSDLSVFPSNYVFEKFETMQKVKTDILIEPQGLYNPYTQFNKKESRKIIEKKYNIPPEYNIILNVVWGEYSKGFDLFSEVSEKLKNDNYSFIWLGSVDEELKKNANEDLILPGFISDVNEIMTFYDACDLFLLTSREDPFPSVVLEAFNANKPVIGFENAGGFEDIVINDKSGYLVKFESVNEIINKIKLICENETLKTTLGNNAKEICGQYNFSNYVKLLKCYCLNGEKIYTLKNKVKSKNKTITNLKEKNQKLQNEKSKITKPLRKLKEIVK